MASLMREKIAHGKHAYDTIAEAAYEMADAMIRRERPERPDLKIVTEEAKGQCGIMGCSRPFFMHYEFCEKHYI